MTSINSKYLFLLGFCAQTLRRTTPRKILRRSLRQCHRPLRGVAPALSPSALLAEGEAAIVKPLDKDFEIIVRVPWDGWAALAP